ncbi:MAG: Zn-ribbon domain-containing OB-fold protein [Chloroflexi bacterium]|nr:Zn-ribbon domain-containing OB-fold protein [Chloroflexota bacterium]
MSAQEQTPYQQRVQHQLAYWDQFRQAQPVEEGGVEMVPLAGTGTIYSFTTVTAPPEHFAPYAPYMMALVQLDEGPLVTAQLTDVDGPVEIGMRVEMVIRRQRTDGERGIIIYGPKFRPLLRPE